MAHRITCCYLVHDFKKFGKSNVPLRDVPLSLSFPDDHRHFKTVFAALRINIPVHF